MQLSPQVLDKNSLNNIEIPQHSIFSLPEKVLQFGTGVLLRGLPDYFIDVANKKGSFNGRVVVVKSTGNGGTDAFSTQECLYTHLIKGIQEGQLINQIIINASISRVLSAATDWDAILATAINPELQIIVSNTTEVGISLLPTDSIFATPPISFPGKLLAILYKRYQTFQGSKAHGCVIIPTELIVDNGLKLKEIVLSLANLHQLENDFIEWLHEANDFCNSLVDRIVPGKLSDSEKAAFEQLHGYTDDLMIMSEHYSLWAIESNKPSTLERLAPLCQTNEGMVVVPSIEQFRELKLRILNGAHTFSCGLAVVAGFATVKDAMKNPIFEQYISQLVTTEIALAITSKQISNNLAVDFGNKVLDRFRNPYLAHQWLSISMQFSSKMKMRNIPTILQYDHKQSSVPKCMALGLAAYILFMKSVKHDNQQYVGTAFLKPYIINDDTAAKLNQYWQIYPTDTIVQAILTDEELWGCDLTQLVGFEEAITHYLQSLIQQGFASTVVNLFKN
jgi:tagaturonate reductase